METIQEWRDEKRSFLRKDSSMDEVFSNHCFQAGFYSLTVGETKPIHPEPYGISIQRNYHKLVETDAAMRYLEAYHIRFVKILHKLIEGSLGHILSLFHDHLGD